MKPSVRTASVLVPAAAVVLLAAPSGASGVRAETPPPVVSRPVLASLPKGAAPALPYVDVRGKRIVDGSRRVSIAGLQGRVTQLFKVDGGYLLGRRVDTVSQLVLVRHSGVRVLVARSWIPPHFNALDPAAVVAGSGSQVVFNTRDDADPSHYGETRIVSLPAGEVTSHRRFDGFTSLGSFAQGHVLLSHGDAGTVYWRPSTGTETTVRSSGTLAAADLTAGQYAVRTGESSYPFQGIPPATSPDWRVEVEDNAVGPWSPDDGLVAVSAEIGEDRTSSFALRRTADGTTRLSLRATMSPQITWESDSRVLVTVTEDDRTWQTIRCNLTGACSRVGAPASTPQGTYVLPTRRNG